jgi:PII-like signaling protein|tara:strand:- start:39 stop:464 length:426 start_codon:yes stop_codon:yes gene_type:complete
MADTRRELILARMKSNLDSITGATVYRSRVEPLARGEVPAVIIEPVNDQPNDTNFFDKIDWTMRVRITTLVRASVPDDTSDTYTQQVHSLLMADQTVNSYALDLTPDRTEFSLYEADVPLGVISMDYLVRYRTSRTDLTSA